MGNIPQDHPGLIGPSRGAETQQAPTSQRLGAALGTQTSNFGNHVNFSPEDEGLVRFCSHQELSQSTMQWDAGCRKGEASEKTDLEALSPTTK